MTDSKSGNLTLTGEKFLSLNIRRLTYFLVLAIPISLIHILIFLFQLDESGTVEHTWRVGIIFSHGLILLFSLILAYCVWRYKSDKTPNRKVFIRAIYISFVFVILAAVIIVGFDQLVTPAITPYLVICLIIALVYIFPPWHAFLFYLGSFVLFLLAIYLVQPDAQISLSNSVNGFTAAGLGFFLSYTLWQNTRDKIQQSLVIEDQKKDMERQNKDLLRQSQKLEHALNTRDRFLSIISHDLKTPFNALLGFSEILLDDWEEIEEKEKKNIIKLIRETSETTFQLLLNLLDWSRIQKETMKARPEVIDFRKLTINVIKQLHAQANLKDITINLEMEQDYQIESDEHMVNSLLRNLLSNAIKFSPNGSTVDIRANFEGHYLVCHVEDHGTGISDEKTGKIFSDNVSVAGTNQEEGTGLGLQLCQEYVKMLNGSIWVKSQINKGSVFSFRIPVQFNS